MMKKNLLVFFNLCLITSLYAQKDSIATAKAIESFHQVINIQSGLYNGVEHTGYAPTIQGTAYFMTKDWHKGAVFYDGMLYPDVMLKYDLVKEKVVVRRFDGFGLELASNKLDYFVLSGRLFRHIHKHTELKPGIYEVLQEGKLTLLAKRTKRIDEDLRENRLLQSFSEHVKYYVLKEQLAYPVKTKNNVLDLMGDKRRQIQQFITQSKISFRKTPEEAMIKMVEYYNQTN